jgi:hypothetical protein
MRVGKNVCGLIGKAKDTSSGLLLSAIPTSAAVKKWASDASKDTSSMTSRVVDTEVTGNGGGNGR